MKRFPVVQLALPFLLCISIPIFAYDSSKGDWVDEIENRFTANQKLALHFAIPAGISYGGAEATDFFLPKSVSPATREVVSSAIGFALGALAAIGKEKFDQSRKYPVEGIKIYLGIGGAATGIGVYLLKEHWGRPQ